MLSFLSPNVLINHTIYYFLIRKLLIHLHTNQHHQLTRQLMSYSAKKKQKRWCFTSVCNTCPDFNDLTLYKHSQQLYYDITLQILFKKTTEVHEKCKKRKKKKLKYLIWVLWVCSPKLSYYLWTLTMDHVRRKLESAKTGLEDFFLLLKLIRLVGAGRV